MAKRGRPRGLTLNPAAVEGIRLIRSIEKGEIAQAGGMTSGHLADAMYRGKGVSAEKVRRIAECLGVQPAAIAPEASGWFVAVRPQDVVEGAA